MIGSSRLARAAVAGLVAAWGLALAAPAHAAGCGVQTSPDGLRAMTNRDVGTERWAITRHPSGVLTGNVFRSDGGSPAFIVCEPGEVANRYRCLGGDGCLADAGAPGAPPRAVSVDPLGGLLLVNKDVGSERWAITENEDGSITGNVFSADGGAPAFIVCEPNGAPDGFTCLGAGPCAAAPCGDDFAPLGDVTLPAGFLARPEACADEYDVIGDAVDVPDDLFDPASCLCGNGTLDAGEECDGAATGPCAGTCQSDCTCSPVCGDDAAEAGELCDGADDARCPGQCSDVCTCPGSGTLELVLESGSELHAGWTGTVHGLRFQRGGRIAGELANCDGQGDTLCDFFGNVGSFCSADPSRACTNDSQCSGAGQCVLQHFGPPLPLSVGGVPACVLTRFSTDAVGTHDLQSGATTVSFGLNAIAHLALGGSDPCPICDCGAADPQACEIGAAGTCGGAGGRACTVQGTGPFGPTSLDCPPTGANVTGSGLELAFDTVTTGTIAFPSSQPCDAAAFQDLGCWCDGQTQPNQCAAACDGGANDAGACGSDAECPGGSCVPLCRQASGATVGECIAGPVVQSCAGAPQVGCTGNGDCPAGAGPCVTRNQSCFADPLLLEGEAGTASNRLVASACVPSGSGAMNQVAGLPGPTALVLPTAVTLARCGDGIADGSREECDGADDGACPGACQADCTCPSTCGNDQLDLGEQCDGPADAACPDACTPPGSPGECTCPTSSSGECGNGALDPAEACELPATGCGPLQFCLLCNECFPPPGLIPDLGGGLGSTCGNQVLESGEACELSGAGCTDGALCFLCAECIPLIPGLPF